jgi:hypothetical protein
MIHTLIHGEIASSLAPFASLRASASPRNDMGAKTDFSVIASEAKNL